MARHDYLPFGEEIPAGYAGRSASLLFGSSDGVEQKFTGQIRDSETGMDFFAARYYASAVGRFTSPDPMNLGADLLDPQSWNAYAYVRNNPLALVDPMGLCTFDAEGNAVEDENGACYGGGFGGSVTVTAQAPPDVMPIFVSLPSLASDTQQPAPTAPPTAVTEAGVGVARPTNTVATISAAPMPWYKNSCITTALGNAALKVGIDAIGLIPEAGGVAREIGHQFLYRGAVADQFGARVIKNVAFGASLGSTIVGLQDKSPTGLVSTSLGTAGIVVAFARVAPVAGQVIAGALIVVDIASAAREIAACGNN